MHKHLQTYKLTNDVGQTSKGKNQIIKFSTKVDNVQRDKKYSSQINLKALFKCKVTASSSQGLTKQCGITLCPQPCKNALKVNKSVLNNPIQKTRWLKPCTQHLLLKYILQTT